MILKNYLKQIGLKKLIASQLGHRTPRHVTFVSGLELGRVARLPWFDPGPGSSAGEHVAVPLFFAVL